MLAESGIDRPLDVRKGLVVIPAFIETLGRQRLIWRLDGGPERRGFALDLPLVAARLAGQRHYDEGTARHGRHFARDTFASRARRTRAPN
jgi:hypothetical protein